MPRKKKSEMTPVELVDQALNGRSWDEAETAGVEILARCMALHVYARKEGEEYFRGLMKRICNRADEWAHEDNHPTILAFAAVGHERQQKENRVSKKEPQI